MDSDIVSLSFGLEVKNQILVDRIVGANHTLHPAAARVVARLQKLPSAKAWLDYAQSQKLKQDNIDELISFINDIAGWQVKRSLAGHTDMSKTRLIMMLRAYRWQRLAHRSRATGLTIAVGLFITLLPLVILLLPAAGVLRIAGFNPSGIVILFSGFLGFVALSTFAHEYVHAHLAAKPAAFIRKGWRLGVLHQPMDPGRELLSALLGPIAGVVVSAALAAGLWVWSANELWLLIGSTSSALHAIGLLPLYGDGKIVFKHRKELRLWPAKR